MRKIHAIVVTIALAGLWACGQGHGNGNGGQPELTLVLKPWGEVGQQAYPGTEVNLRVVAYRSAGTEIEDEGDLVPAVGEAIAWSFLGGTPATATLSQPATATDSHGLSSVTVAVGTAANQSLQIRAIAANADPVVFSIQVGRDDRALELLVSQSIDSVVNRSERLRVRLVRMLPGGVTGPPIAGEPLRVEFVDGVRSGARLEPDPGDVVTVTTDGAGVASIRFLTGAIAQTGYQIQFCGQAACPGVAPRSVTINVALRGSGGADCQYFTDCEEGYICDLGTCKPAAFYCNDNGDCPAGYTCDSLGTRQCTLVTPGGGACGECFDNDDCSGGDRCGGAGHCVPPDGCLSNTDCPHPPEVSTAWTCDQCGACIPPGDPGTINDVRGLWYTTYRFDISDTLPGFITGGLGPVVDFLNLVFWSELEINVPIVGDILEAMLDAIIAEYVPPWVRTVVTVLADIIHLFEELEVEGEMSLIQPTLATVPPRLSTDVTGDEAWTSARVFVRSLCPGGPTDPTPGCGAVDIILDSDIDVDYSNEDLVVDVDVAPFIGQVMGDTLRLNGRSVDFELAQFINVVLDVVVQIASGGSYSDFETFLVDAVPCADLQQAIDDLFCDITGGDICAVPGVEQACEAAAIAATAALNEILGDVSIALLQLDFDQRALIHAAFLGSPATQLGDPTDPTDNAESAIIGESQFGPFGGDFDDDSWWYGTRHRD
jgi:hypothetical protein